MKTSESRILTTHTGSLPRSDALLQGLLRLNEGQEVDRAAFDDNGNPAFAGYGAVYIVPVQVTSPCPQPGC